MNKTERNLVTVQTIIAYQATKIMPPKHRKTPGSAATLSDQVEDELPEEAIKDSATKMLLEAITSLRTEFCVLKTELSDLIGTRIEPLSKDIRSELTSIKKETTAAISSIEIKHANQLTHLEQDSSTVDTVVKMEKEVERFPL